MLSFGTEKLFAFSTADASVMLPSTLPPPSRAATSTARRSLAYMLDRLESVASFLRLIVAHLECPDMPLHLPQEVVVERRLADELRMEGCHEQVALLQHDRMPLVRRQDADVGAEVLHPRGTDEHPTHGMVDALHLQV